MGINGEFFLKFLEPFFGGLVAFFKAIGAAIVKIFNIATYFDIIKEYKAKGSSTIIIILAVLSLIILFAVIALLIFLLVRRIIKWRHNVSHHEKMVEEIESLNNDVVRLRNENQKYLEMANPDSGVEYDENGNITNKLSEGESRFFKLTQIDEKYKDYVAPDLHETITLDKLCETFRNYSASQMKLYYSIDLIRLYIASFASNRLIILQGISGTGKTSLAYAFGNFIKNEAVIASVQPSWRDSTELFGYFNEFTKKFNETEVLKEMYLAGYTDDVYTVILDEMNISRVEYYFAEMLSILEMPNKDEWIVELVSASWKSDPKKITDGKLHIPPNMWYIGTINNDDSTFMVTDKVYDRAMPLDINDKGQVFEPKDVPSQDINYTYLDKLFTEAIANNPISQDTLDKIEVMDNYVIQHFRIAFGNRIVAHMKKFVPVYVACGGTEVDGVDYFLARKVLRKFEQLNISYIRDEIDGYIEFLDKLFGKGKMKECEEYLLRLKKLT